MPERGQTMRTILIVAAMTAVAGPSLAQSAMEKYELAERCGRAAAEAFTKLSSALAAANYQNHYNSKLNKCFYFVKVSDALLQLVDINENKEYARYQEVDGKAGQLFRPG